MLLLSRFAPTATILTILTLAPLTATTAPATSRAESSSAPARGLDGIAPASAPDTTAEATGIAAPPIAADRHLGRLLPRSTGTPVAGSAVGRVSTAEVRFTAGAASTVAAGN